MSRDSLHTHPLNHCFGKCISACWHSSKKYEDAIVAVLFLNFDSEVGELWCEKYTTKPHFPFQKIPPEMVRFLPQILTWNQSRPDLSRFISNFSRPWPRRVRIGPRQPGTNHLYLKQYSNKKYSVDSHFNLSTLINCFNKIWRHFVKMWLSTIAFYLSTHFLMTLRTN